MKIHYLKTVGTVWDAVASGEKKFEVRKNDRFFQKGDHVILLHLFDSGVASGQQLEFKIGWMLMGGQYGIEPGYVVFSLEPIE